LGRNVLDLPAAIESLVPDDRLWQRRLRPDSLAQRRLVLQPAIGTSRRENGRGKRKVLR
jgi:hypothetical protein